MPAGGRLGDKAFCPADGHGCVSCPHPVEGPAVQGSPDVLTNSMPALRVGDDGIHASCCGPNTWNAAKGSGTVFINGQPAHRMGDKTTHCGGEGTLVQGSSNVIIGDGTGSGTTVSGFGSGSDAPVLTAQKGVFTQAAQSGTPFCAVCEAAKQAEAKAVAAPSPRDWDKEEGMRKAAAQESMPLVKNECPYAKVGNKSDPLPLFLKPEREVHSVFLHCSASDVPAHDFIEVIRKWHKDRGWKDIGYHFFIKKDGTIQNGRSLEKIPAAQSGHNTGSIAICLHGLDKDKFTKEQFRSLIKLCRNIKNAYKDKKICFRGHKEVSSKSCPVFDYKKVLGLDDKGYIH